MFSSKVFTVVYNRDQLLT